MTKRFIRPNIKSTIKGQHSECIITDMPLMNGDEAGLSVSDVFIRRMLNIGAGVELSCSKYETELYVQEAKALYVAHLKELNLPTKS